ncbi:YitT family protein [Niallia circulans]|uniref:YitT family protein n=1 Tax=Niallia circulans TaxID=1397 RepID=UPI0015617B04|nr:YitT family protein [Niallia circulans]MCM2982513.1 YitT family protein [Niallia circulans]NRG30464.1 YitT family protein [Niallia circulans]
MIEKIAAIFVGSLLIGMGVNGFLVPHHLLDGGIIGIGLILHYHYEVPTGLSMILLSIPLYILVWFYNREYFFYGIIGFLASSISIDFLSFLRDLFSLKLVLSAILGGVIIGVGIGLMLRFETSTGGTDLLAQVLSKILSIQVGLIIFLIDGIVLASGYKIIGLTTFSASFLTIFCVAVFTTLLSKNFPIRKER